jgi:hypothetical protein
MGEKVEKQVLPDRFHQNSSFSNDICQSYYKAESP